MGLEGKFILRFAERQRGRRKKPQRILALECPDEDKYFFLLSEEDEARLQGITYARKAINVGTVGGATHYAFDFGPPTADLIRDGRWETANSVLSIVIGESRSGHPRIDPLLEAKQQTPGIPEQPVVAEEVIKALRERLKFLIENRPAM